MARMTAPLMWMGLTEKKDSKMEIPKKTASQKAAEMETKTEGRKAKKKETWMGKMMESKMES